MFSDAKNFVSGKGKCPRPTEEEVKAHKRFVFAWKKERKLIKEEWTTWLEQSKGKVSGAVYERMHKSFKVMVDDAHVSARIPLQNERYLPMVYENTQTPLLQTLHQHHVFRQKNRRDTDSIICNEILGLWTDEWKTVELIIG